MFYAGASELEDKMKETMQSENKIEETTPSMEDFAADLDKSFKQVAAGDILDVTVIGVSDTEVTVDFNYYTEGIIPLEECSSDPAFSIKNDITVGDIFPAMVINPENRDGAVVFSKKQAQQEVVWDILQKDFEERKIFTVKVHSATNGGVIAYVREMRGFIPASQLALSYVEAPEEYVGKTLEVIILELDKAKEKCILSAKTLLKEKAALEKSNRIGRLTVGAILPGTIERMENYGVFVNIGEGLTGLVHISQITDKFIKSPKEVVKLGEQVNVKILAIEGDRIRLSIKATQEKTEDTPDIPADDEPLEYHDADEPSGYMASLLKDIQL